MPEYHASLDSFIDLHYKNEAEPRITGQVITEMNLNSKNNRSE